MATKPEKILKQPEILDRLDDVRKKFAGSDDPRAISQFEGWERRAKKSLILLSLKDNAGVRMILKKAEGEVRTLKLELQTERPTDFSPAGVAAYASKRAASFAALDMWMWLISLFTEAAADLEQVDQEIAVQEEPQEEDF